MNSQARVEDARARLDRMRIALGSPSPREIEEALPELEHPVACVHEVERALASGTAPVEGLTTDLTALAQEVGVVERLTQAQTQQQSALGSWAQLPHKTLFDYVG